MHEFPLHPNTGGGPPPQQPSLLHLSRPPLFHEEALKHPPGSLILGFAPIHATSPHHAWGQDACPHHPVAGVEDPPLLLLVVSLVVDPGVTVVVEPCVAHCGKQT